MTQSRNAIGNLITRYNSVLTRCNLLNHEIMKKIASVTVSTCFIFLGCVDGADAWATSDLVVEVNPDVCISTNSTYDKISIPTGGVLSMAIWYPDTPPPLTVNANSLENAGGELTVAYGTLTIAENTTNTGKLTVTNWGSNIPEPKPSAILQTKNLTNNTSGSINIYNGDVTVSETFTNNSTNGYVDVNGTPFWDSATTVVSNGTLNVGTFENTNGLLIVSNGTLNATTINNSTVASKSETSDKQDDNGNLLYSTSGSTIWFNSGTVGNISTTVINNSGNILVDNGTINIKEWNNEATALAKVGGGQINIATLKNAGTFWMHQYGACATLTTTDLSNTGNFSIDKGTLTVSNNFENKGTFNINAGEVNVGTNIANDGGTFTINGGNLYTTTIENKNLGQFTIKNATVGNKQTGKLESITHTDGKFTIDGGAITVTDGITNSDSVDFTLSEHGDPTPNEGKGFYSQGGGTLTTPKFNNDGYATFNNTTVNVDTYANNAGAYTDITCWYGETKFGDSETVIDNSGYFHVDQTNNNSSTYDTTVTASKLINNEGAHAKIGGGTLDIKTITNDGDFLIHSFGSDTDGPSINVTDFTNNGTCTIHAGELTATTIDNSGKFIIHNGSVTADTWNNIGSGYLELNKGTLSVDTIYVGKDSKFIVHGGTLNVDTITSEDDEVSNIHLCDTNIKEINVTKNVELSIEKGTTITLKENIISGEDNGVANNGTITLNKESILLTNTLDNGSQTNTDASLSINGGLVYIGDYDNFDSKKDYFASTAPTPPANGLIFRAMLAPTPPSTLTTNYGTIYITNGPDATLGGALIVDTDYSNYGTINISDCNTLLEINNNFVNGSETFYATIKAVTETDALTATDGGSETKIKNDFTNLNGEVNISDLGTSFTVEGNVVNGNTLLNYVGKEPAFHIASGIENANTFITGCSLDITVDGNFTNKVGKVEVFNYGTNLTINGTDGFTNGTQETEATLHTMNGATITVAKGDLHNIHGIVGVHGGEIIVPNGTFINDSDVIPPKDPEHKDVFETVHVLHDGELIAQKLEHNVGTMGVGAIGGQGVQDSGLAVFRQANSKENTTIAIHDDGTFVAQNGDIKGKFTIDAASESGGVDGILVVRNVTTADGVEDNVNTNGSGFILSSLYSEGDVDIQNGTLTISSGHNIGDTSEFTIASGAAFTKQGGATENMVISNKIVNKGTMNVTGGGLVLEGLQNAGDIAHPSDPTKQKVYNDYAGHFVTEGDIVVSGQNAYLKLDGDIDNGALDNEALNSLITEGYATSNSTHDSVTMKQASILFYDGVGIVLAGNDAKLIVSNAASATSADRVDFGDGTLFKFNGHNYSRKNAPITIADSAGSINIDAEAKFFATNLIANKFYTIIENVDASAETELAKSGWKKSINDEGALHRMIKDVEIEYVAKGDIPTGADATFISDTNDIVLAAGGIKDENFGVDEGIFESMKDLWEKEKNDKESGNAGNGFVSDAASETVIPDDKEAGKTLESATNAAITGGIVNLTTDASDIMSQAVNVRMDGLHADSGGYAEDISATDWGIWAIPLYQQSQVRNIDIGKTTGGYDGWLAGVVAGIDRKKDEWTLGVALGIGIGEMESTDNFVDTDTDIDFWSAIAYAAYHKNHFEWKADFTYTNAASEITQANPYNLIAVAPIRADVDGQLFSIGTQISYKIIDDDVDVTPHIGLRYRAYRQDSYTTNIDGRELFDVKYADMDTLLLPVGVLLSTDFVWNEWLFTPRMDLVYTAFFGDTAINNYFGFAGSGDDVDAFGTVEMQSDILDDYMLSLSVGCGAKKDKWSFGLDFDFQRSENREAQAVFARVAYRY